MKIDQEKDYQNYLKNEKWIIGQLLVDDIIDLAAHNLFSSPEASEAPPDSFAEDYTPDFWVKLGEEIEAKRLEKLRREEELRA